MAETTPNAHDLWEALQTAYNRYKNATRALDAVLTVSTNEFPSPDRTYRIEAAAGIQRTTFEEYIEARLQFSECLNSEHIGDSLDSTPRDAVASRLDRRPPTSRALLFGAAMLVLALTVSAAELVRCRKQITLLERSREILNAEINQKDNWIQTLASQLDTLKAANLANAMVHRSSALLDHAVQPLQTAHKPLRRRSGNRKTIAARHLPQIQAHLKRGSPFTYRNQLSGALRSRRSSSLQGKPAA